MVITYHIRQRPSSHGNVIFPLQLLSNFWNGQICCSYGKGMIAYQCFFVLRGVHNHLVDMFSICLFRMERNDSVSFHFRITYLVDPFFGRGTALFEMFPPARSPTVFHVLEQYRTMWNN